jgi:hypothetical protein
VSVHAREHADEVWGQPGLAQAGQVLCWRGEHKHIVSVLQWAARLRNRWQLSLSVCWQRAKDDQPVSPSVEQ